MRIWGIHKKYKALSWWENFIGGHLSIGNLTIYGSNAMCWVVNLRTKKWGYICFTLPSIARFKDKRKRMYFYLSPNGTPWASTFYLGKDKSEKHRSKKRKKYLGHNFDIDEQYEKLTSINCQKNFKVKL